MPTYLRGCSFWRACNYTELADKRLLCCFTARHVVGIVDTAVMLQVIVEGKEEVVEFEDQVARMVQPSSYRK